MSDYTPELGQAFNATRSWSAYELPEYVTAMFFGIKEEIERVYWNRNQKRWEGYEDPGIEGIVWRPYYWGDNEVEADKPNFAFEDVKIRWYKYPGRGMSTNHDWQPDQWVTWFDRCIACIRKADIGL